MGATNVARVRQNHGGRLWAISNENGGATFQFTMERLIEGPIGKKDYITSLKRVAYNSSKPLKT